MHSSLADLLVDPVKSQVAASFGYKWSQRASSRAAQFAIGYRSWHDLPLLGIRAGTYDVQRSIYRYLRGVST